jgi:hypothetical protein
MQLASGRETLGGGLDRFARRVTWARTVWTISTPKGLARVPSRARLGCEVNLFWSGADLAEPWLSRFPQSRINPIWLRDIGADVLPKLHQLNRLAGCDWVAGAHENELDPSALEDGLRRAAIATFAGEVRAKGTVWVLEDDAGPAFAASQDGRGKLLLPCWSSRAGVETVCNEFWRDMMVSAIDSDRFCDRTLAWLGDIGRGLSLNHGLGVPVEASPSNLAGRMKIIKSARAPRAAIA